MTETTKPRAFSDDATFVCSTCGRTVRGEIEQINAHRDNNPNGRGYPESDQEVVSGWEFCLDCATGEGNPEGEVVGYVPVVPQIALSRETIERVLRSALRMSRDKLSVLVGSWGTAEARNDRTTHRLATADTEAESLIEIVIGGWYIVVRDTANNEEKHQLGIAALLRGFGWWIARGHGGYTLKSVKDGVWEYEITPEQADLIVQMALFDGEIRYAD